MGKYILKFPFIATIAKLLYLDKIVLKFGQLLSETEISIYCRDKGTPPLVMDKKKYIIWEQSFVAFEKSDPAWQVPGLPQERAE